MGEITVSLGAGYCKHCGCRLRYGKDICYECKEKYKVLEKRIYVKIKTPPPIKNRYAKKND